MTHNRRKSPFRYVLKKPVSFELLILRINDQAISSKPVDALLLDLSRSGCRISLPLEISAKDHDVLVSMDMLLDDNPLRMEGKLQWYREEAGRYHYGVQLNVTSFSRDHLLRELRLLASKDLIVIT